MTKRILVTGGAGFIGCNLARNLLSEGLNVTIFDSLVRRGSQKNLSWLSQQYTGLEIVKGDIRDFNSVKHAAAQADVIYHLAGQVAVTSSIQDPRSDFEVNALGTLNILEAARQSKRQPIVVFTSTNKVYGEMGDVPVVEERSRYAFKGLPQGISERRPVDFHSPYGCSKGAADQYVRDYARIYDLPTVVFRMSCIYGPRQFGTEDQGWIAHFIISVLSGRPITIYGNGKQVRDVLFVDDLVRALRLAVDKIDITAGEVFNIGGGPTNTISIWKEFGEILSNLSEQKISVSFDDWRSGDQACYVSDIQKAGEVLEWRPLIDTETGIRHLWAWASSNLNLFEVRQLVS